MFEIVKIIVRMCQERDCYAHKFFYFVKINVWFQIVKAYPL